MRFFVSLAIRALARLLVSPRDHDGSKDLEILVLRPEPGVLRRKTSPPKLLAIDRVLLAAASRAIPRGRWSCFMVTPATLVRWHRELVRKRRSAPELGPVRGAEAFQLGKGRDDHGVGAALGPDDG